MNHMSYPSDYTAVPDFTVFLVWKVSKMLMYVKNSYKDNHLLLVNKHICYLQIVFVVF